MSELVHLQLLLLAVRAPDISLEHYGTQLAHVSVLYQWLGPSRYVGAAGVQRLSRPMMPGTAQRWWEHLLHRCRPNLKGASLKKYIYIYGLFRNRPPANSHPKSKLRHRNVPGRHAPAEATRSTKVGMALLRALLVQSSLASLWVVHKKPKLSTPTRGRELDKDAP